MILSLERDPAWEANQLRRERLQGLWLSALAGPLMLSWSIFDRILEPRWFWPFFAGRAAYLLLAAGLFAALLGARSLATVRALTAVTYVAAGFVIAWMLPRVERHHELYVLGFSIVFWTIGVASSWPAKYSLGIAGVVLGAYAVTHLAYAGPRTRDEIVGTLFFIGTATVFSVVSCGIRARLERGTFDASRALEDAQGQMAATEKLSAVGRLLSGMSHEINNPLNVIQNNLGPVRDYAEALRGLVLVARAELPAGSRYETKWNEVEGDFVVQDCGAALSTISAAVQRLQSIHADLRTFIRGDAPTLWEGDLNEGLRTTAAMVGRNLPPGVRLRADLGKLPRCTFRPGQMNQVWLNLLQNAIDAVGAKGEISIASRAVEGGVEIAISDDGSGVAPSVRDRLFEPFVTTKGAGKGTGLGLAVSYEIVKNHGGLIFLDETHSPGARFVVRMPLHAREPTSS